MSGLTFLYAASTAAAVTALCMSLAAMKKDSSLSMRNNLVGATIFAAGFCLFPILNVAVTLWLGYELRAVGKGGEANE